MPINIVPKALRCGTLSLHEHPPTLWFLENQPRFWMC